MPRSAAARARHAAPVRALHLGALLAALVAGDAGCFRSTRPGYAADEKTVLEVDNQAFEDVNVFVIPEASGRVRLGLAVGKTRSHFVIPDHAMRGVRQLRFQALPIATPRGPITEDITVTPGDTVVLIIPPG